MGVYSVVQNVCFSLLIFQITNLLSVYQVVSILFHPFIATSFQLNTGTNFLFPIYFLSLDAQVLALMGYVRGLCRKTQQVYYMLFAVLSFMVKQSAV